MSELPPGFVLDGQAPQGAPAAPAESPAGLPAGFVLDGQPQQAAEPQKFGLMDTWPARMAKAIYSGVTLPRDVLTGQTQIMDPNTGHTSQEVINRSFDLAAVGSPVSPVMRAGGTFAGTAKPLAAPSSEMLKDAARAGYQSPEVS